MASERLTDKQNRRQNNFPRFLKGNNMSLKEFAAVASVGYGRPIHGKSVSFIYHGTRRIGEIVEAIVLPNGDKPYGYITIDEKKDGFRRFSVRKMSEINVD
jgi:hypothetical protein